MIIRGIFVALLIGSCTRLCAQNLVPNPSFEEVTACPGGFSQIVNAVPWQSFRASPDLFHGCAAGDFDVPENIFGTRAAASGIGYAGMYCYYEALDNQREYIGVQLTEPLTPGVVARVSFKVVASGGGGETWVMSNWISGIGLKFSMSAWYEGKNTVTTSNEADVYSEAVIEHSTAWTTISGTFVPDSAYTHVVLGNFFEDELITVEPTGWPGANTPGGYYYVDDVCVSQDPVGTCGIHTGLAEANEERAPSAWYDASTGSIRVEGPDQGRYPIALIDASGRTVRTAGFSGPGTQVLIPVSDLAAGIYVVRMANNEGMSRRVYVP